MAKNKELISFRDSIKESQEGMASNLGVSLSFYIKVEHGLRNPSFNFVTKFKRKFPNANINKIFFNNQLHIECDNKSAGTNYK